MTAVEPERLHPSAADGADRLAEAVVERRRLLNHLPQQRVTERGGPSTETMRLIEGAHRDSYSPRTLDQLDQALRWPLGTSDEIMRTGVIPDVPKPEPEPDEDWAALAHAVRSRREWLRLRQGDLEGYGGPSDGTVRNIEQGARTKYASRTLAQLDRSLGWVRGTARRVVDGSAPSDQRLWEAAESPAASAAAEHPEQPTVPAPPLASLRSLAARWSRRDAPEYGHAAVELLEALDEIEGET